MISSSPEEILRNYPKSIRANEQTQYRGGGKMKAQNLVVPVY